MAGQCYSSLNPFQYGFEVELMLRYSGYLATSQLQGFPNAPVGFLRVIQFPYTSQTMQIGGLATINCSRCEFVCTEALDSPRP